MANLDSYKAVQPCLMTSDSKSKQSLGFVEIAANYRKERMHALQYTAVLLVELKLYSRAQNIVKNAEPPLRHGVVSEKNPRQRAGKLQAWSSIGGKKRQTSSAESPPST